MTQNTVHKKSPTRLGLALITALVLLFPVMARANAAQSVYWLFKVEPAALAQSLDTVRNRLDQFGLADAVVERKDADGIAVRLKDVPDVERLKAALLAQAQLEFRLVEDRYSGLPDTNAELPDDCELLYEAGQGQAITHVVREEVLMTGDCIEDARGEYEQHMIRPCVTITLSAECAALFERITAENVGRRLAMVLDGKVVSAPVIQEKIGGGQIMLAGDFTLAETQDLALMLRAGAMPVPLVLAEERLE